MNKPVNVNLVNTVSVFHSSARTISLATGQIKIRLPNHKDLVPAETL